MGLWRTILWGSSLKWKMTTECIVLSDIDQNDPDEKCTFGELFIEIDHRMICLIYFKITLIEGWVPERDHGTYINLSDIAQNDPNRGIGLWGTLPWNRPWNKNLLSYRISLKMTQMVRWVFGE